MEGGAKDGREEGRWWVSEGREEGAEGARGKGGGAE